MCPRAVLKRSQVLAIELAVKENFDLEEGRREGGKEEGREGRSPHSSPNQIPKSLMLYF